MQFKKLMADKIMAGEKTATRRLKKPRFKVGSRQPVQNGYRDKARCYIVIDVIYEQTLLLPDQDKNQILDEVVEMLDDTD